MTHINLDAQDDVVKQFVLGLTQASILELNGQPVVCVVPTSSGGATPTGTWDQAKNNRRCELIDREFDGPPLTPSEIVELEGLQDEMLRYRQRVAPLPIDDARKLHQELLVKAAAQTIS